ncbi:hypothetical protein RCL1_003752 [Eukaryota sp. TZLM3-RCL]
MSISIPRTLLVRVFTHCFASLQSSDNSTTVPLVSFSLECFRLLTHLGCVSQIWLEIYFEALVSSLSSQCPTFDLSHPPHPSIGYLFEMLALPSSSLLGFSTDTCKLPEYINSSMVQKLNVFLSNSYSLNQVFDCLTDDCYPKLFDLSITNFPTSNDPLQFLSKISNLQSFSLHFFDCSSNVTSPLLIFPYSLILLRQISLINCPYIRLNLATLKLVKYLTIRNCKNLKELFGLNQLPFLIGLELSDLPQLIRITHFHPNCALSRLLIDCSNDSLLELTSKCEKFPINFLGFYNINLNYWQNYLLFDKVVWLEINQSNLIDLSLSSFPFLEHVAIISCKELTHIDFSRLPCLQSISLSSLHLLSKFSCSCTLPVSKLSLFDVQFSSLCKLVCHCSFLRYCSFSSLIFDCFPRNPLTFSYLSCLELKDLNFSFFKQNVSFPLLKCLSVSNCSLINFDSSDNFPLLQFLSFSDCKILDEILVDSGFHLKSIHIEMCTKLKSIEFLESCINLIGLRLYDCPSVVSLSPLSFLKSLQLFEYRGGCLSVENFIENFPRLRFVNIELDEE